MIVRKATPEIVDLVFRIINEQFSPYQMGVLVDYLKRMIDDAEVTI